jgi:general secretion pathway protein G
MNRTRRNRRGFTLLEVLLVVAILGMLATVAIMGYGGIRKKAQKDTTQRLIDGIANQLSLYNNDIGHYPSEEEGGLEALRTKPQFDDEKLEDKWAGPYLTRDPADAWGNTLSYERTEPGTEEADSMPFKVWSNGPNGQDDNGAEDDIRNAAWAAAEAD